MWVLELWYVDSRVFWEVNCNGVAMLVARIFCVVTRVLL